MTSTLLMFAALDKQLPTACRLMSLRQYESAVHIGIHAHERLAAQRMWFDIDVCVRLEAAAAAQDDIAHTLDYDFMRSLVQQTVAQQVHHELQETLCDRLLSKLLAHPSIQAARVRTQKPDAYPDCQSIGIERVGLNAWPTGGLPHASK